MAIPQQMLEATAAIIADYRAGEIAPPDSAHVQRWLNQFEEGVREPLLSEVNHVLGHTYLSKQKFESFLSNLIANEKLTSGDPKKFWSGVKFLDIQSHGRSQHELLAMLAVPLKKETGLEPAQCGASPSCFVYLDDGLYSGNTILSSLRQWLKTDAPNKAVVHVIVVALHRYGQYWASTNLKKDAAALGKEVEFKWWRLVELEDRRAHTSTSDVLRPTKIPADARVEAYAGKLKFKPVLRTPGSVGDLKIFSSEAGRDLLEQELLVKGVHIRDVSQKLPEFARPLGNVVLETLGFGSTIVTFRNCPNGAPLAFWCGNPWYPLFPRKTN
jgi:hypothetical protein